MTHGPAVAVRDAGVTSSFSVCLDAGQNERPGKI